MSPSRQDASSDERDVDRPRPDDPVLRGLRDVEERYLAIYRQLQRRGEVELDQLRQDNEEAKLRIAALEGELDRQRQHAQGQGARAEALANALRDIHRSLFASNVYDLVLKACLTLTGATRGLFVTTSGNNQRFVVRAAVEVDDYPSATPSSLVTALSRTALATQGVSAYHDTSALPEKPSDAESFRNCLVAPVVLRNDLSGAVIVADKAGGDFDDADAEMLLSVGSQSAVAIENNRLQRELHEAYLSLVTVLAETMAARTQLAHPRDEAACRLAMSVGERLGISEYERSVVYFATLLHDVGNIGVSDGVLNKPGPLLDAERQLIRSHVQTGHDLLRQIPVLESIAQIVRHHHERWDGGGYPDGLGGEAIPLPARIVAVVDAYFAILAPRSYRAAGTPDRACEELRHGSGTQFDPRVVDVFLEVLDDAGDQVGGTPRDSVDIRLPGVQFGDARRGNAASV